MCCCNKLKASVELKQIISLYEAESNRKRKSTILNIFSLLLDKIKSLFYVKASYPIHSFPKTIQTIEPQIQEQEIDVPLSSIDNEGDFDLNNLEFESIDDEADYQLENDLDDDLNLEALQAFFNKHAPTESDDLLNQFLSGSINDDSNEDESEPSESIEHNIHAPTSEFASRSYFQRIQEHAKQETQNEELWRRRQTILNNR